MHSQLELYHFYTRQHVSHLALASRMGKGAEHHIKDAMLRQFAAFAVDKLRVRKHHDQLGPNGTPEGLYHTFEMDAYVIPPEVLYQVIQDEARRLMYLAGLGAPEVPGG